jgi:hypothetical protein
MCYSTLCNVLLYQVKEMLEEHAYEERFQEDPDESYHVEDCEEAFNEVEVLSLNDPDEDIQSVHSTKRKLFHLRDSHEDS